MRIHLGTSFLVLGLGTCSAFALTDEEIFRDFRFNLINPGARSLSLGGAFISLADDATAAQANPAGLSLLLTSEYFLEVRAVDNGGRVGLSRENLPAGIDTVVATGSNLGDVQSPAFASAVFPIKRLTLALSRQEVLNTENDTLNSFSFTFTGSPGVFSADGSGSIDVRQKNYNVSGGFRVNDKFAVGASIAFSRLEVHSEVENFIVDTNGNVAQSVILEPTLDTRTTIHDHDTDFGFTVGAIVRPSRRFNIGAVYRQAPKFSVVEVIDPFVDKNGNATPDEGDEGIDTFDVRATLGSRFSNTFNIPDSFGIGASWSPYQDWTFALDIERIEYSDLTDGFTAGVNILTDFDAEFTVDDATEFRLGAEYSLYPKLGMPLALRAGVFTQSDNTLRALSTGTNSFATTGTFPGRDTEIHGAVGLGIGAGRLKVDLGAELGDSDNEFLVSFIVKGKVEKE